MENKELADSLKEVFTIVNEEARIVSGNTLARCLSQTFEGPGLSWLLETAKAWNLVDTKEIDQKAQLYRDMLRSEEGRKALKLELRQRQKEIIKWRRRLISHIKTWQISEPSLEIQIQALANPKEIYGLLISNPEKPGGVKDEDSLHSN